MIKSLQIGDNMQNHEFIKLKEERIKHGYSFQQMADLLGISKSYYWQIEKNSRRLYYEMAVKIAKIFGKKPDDIFFDYIK